MNKYNLHRLELAVQKLQEQYEIHKKFKIIEVDEEDTAFKFLSYELYDTEGIANFAKGILPKYKHDYVQQFRVLKKIEQLDNAFKYVTIEPEKPIFSIVDKSKGQWVLFCIIQQKMEDEYKTTVLYKDPCGDSIPETLDIQLKKKFFFYKVIENHEVDQPYYDNCSYGPLTLRNLKILLDFFHKENPLSTFKQLKFAKKSLLKKERLSHAAQLLDVLGKDEPFKDTLKQFFNLLPVDISTEIEKYRTVLKEELQKDNRHVNHNKINAARTKHLAEGKLDKLEDDFKLEQNKESKEYVLEAHRKFPKQMREFTYVFKFLQKTRVNEALLTILEIISRLLGLEVATICKFYKPLQKEEEQKKPSSNISDIAKRLPEMKPVVYTKCTPLFHILVQILFGLYSEEAISPEEIDKFEAAKDAVETDKNTKQEKTVVEITDEVKSKEEDKSPAPESPVTIPPASEPLDPELPVPEPSDPEPPVPKPPHPIPRLQFLDDEIEDLATKCEIIEAIYTTWQDKSIAEVNRWARTWKLGLALDDDAICTALAVMDRAFNLVTGGSRLRHPQIVAVLILLHVGQTTGRFCEIQSGEGKTIIVSLIAIIRCLQGFSVDVITSNSILAELNVKATETFFQVFDFTVSTNNPGDKIGYGADVVFGTIQQFQSDYLLDVFEDLNVRQSRRFNVLIFDEICSMTIDKQTNVTRLARSYPGMEFLRYIYIKIWEELHKVEESFAEESHRKIGSLLKTCTEEQAQHEIDSHMQQLIAKERTTLKNKMKSSDLIDLSVIPAHWQQFATEHIPKWLKSALHAKYNCHEYRQYRIFKNEEGDRQILPIGDFNSLRNTIWENGLLQFIQLKHNLHISYETLVATLISNVAYIKKYETGQIFGVTTTLGSTGEQEHLRKIYSLNFFKVPPFIRKRFEELPGIIFGDPVWATQVTLRIAGMADTGRAVMAIFNTEEDVLIVQRKLETLSLHSDQFTIRMYLTVENFEGKLQSLRSKEIILAANIAAYGPSFRVLEEVDTKGGLHIFVCFLPCNLRSERQAFGRTSRQGQNGSAQLLIRQSEVEQLGMGGEEVDFSKIKERRDKTERHQLRYIYDYVYKDVEFMDELHGLFRILHRRKTYEATTKCHEYALQDLEEFWAFWLLQKNYSPKTTMDTTSKEEFAKFLQEAQAIINGKVCHNPYYCVALASYYLKNDRLDKARSFLNYALNLGGRRNDKILAGLHMKLFEANIKSGHQLLGKFNSTQEIINVECAKNEDYKKFAKKQLEKAQCAIAKDIEYIEKNLTVANPNFFRILRSHHDINPVLKQIHSRLFALKFLEGNIAQLMDMLSTAEGEIDLEGKAKVSVANFSEISYDPKKLSNFLLEDVLFELRCSNLDTIYSLEEISNASFMGVVNKQIRAGITLFVIGLTFPPLFKTMSTAAVTIICEATVDVTLELTRKPVVEYENSLKIRFMESFNIPLSLNVDSWQNSVILLTKILHQCQEFSSFYRMNTRSKALCNRLTNYMDRLTDISDKKLALVDFQRMEPWEKLNHLQNLKQAGKLVNFNRLGGEAKLQELLGYKNLGQLQSGVKSFQATVRDIVNTNKNLYNSITNQLMSSSMSEMSVTEIIKAFFELLQKGIRDNLALLQKLHTTSTEKIFKALKGLTEKGQFVAVKEFLADKIVDLVMGTQLAEYYITAEGFVRDTPELNEFVVDFTTRLEKKLQGGHMQNDVEKMVADICGNLEEQLLTWARIVLEGTRKMHQYGVGTIKLARKCGLMCGCVRDDYEILGVGKDATLAGVKNRYRTLILMIWADESKSGRERMKELEPIDAAFLNILKKIKT